MKLPVISGKNMIKLLVGQGFKTVRQKGDHVSLHKKTENGHFLVVVPLHKEINRDTLMSILKQAGMTRQEFIKLASKK